jgi:hypothetical protein
MSSFNKGGALRMAQRIANKNFYNDFKLILDSDICLPPIFLEVLKDKNLDEEAIYGAPRWLYNTVDDFKHKPLNRKLEDHWVKMNTVIGFFQLYKSKNLYEESVDCGQIDIDFCEKFKTKKFINLIVNHIGEPYKNWKGK